MDPRATHDHPAAVLVDRLVDLARADLGSEGRSISDRATALFSSMFSIVVLCEETLLNRNVLKKISFEDDSWRFAPRLFAAQESEDLVPTSVGQLLRFLRNSLAHGKVNLEPEVKLVRTHKHGVTFEKPFTPEVVVSPDFYGIVIWGELHKGSGRISTATLSIANMWKVITGLQELAHLKRNWSPDAKQWAEEDWRWPVPEPIVEGTEHDVENE